MSGYDKTKGEKKKYIYIFDDIPRKIWHPIVLKKKKPEGFFFVILSIKRPSPSGFFSLGRMKE